MFKRVLLAVMCIFLCLAMLTGCQSSTEVEKLAIVAGFSIDVNQNNPDKPVLMTFEVMDFGADPSGSGAGISSTVVQTEGKGVFNAVRSASVQTANRLYFAHAKVMVLGEQVAKKRAIAIFRMGNEGCRT